MLGAIVGDIAGSLYEFGGTKSKDFQLFPVQSRPTDDSIMTIAIACACVDADCTHEEEFKRAVCHYMRLLGRQYPYAGYGEMFFDWLMHDDAGPYNSFGNGSAMRVSPVAWVADSLEEAERLAQWSAEVTHDHPEGIRGAQAVAAAVYLARTGKAKEQIRDYIQQHYYDLDFTIDAIRPSYRFDVTCQGSVPQAIVCFLEARDFEDAIRNAISLSGDSDTQAAMAGAIAEAFFGIPEKIQEEALDRLDATLMDYLDECMDQIYHD